MRPVYDHFGIENLPISNKKPVLSGWLTRKYGTKAEQCVEKLAPLAQVGILMKANDLVVVDVDFDDGQIADTIIEIFGSTPIIVRTRRGFHFYYRYSLGTTARAWEGIDLKAGNAYVVSPLSDILNEKDKTVGRYQFISEEFEWLTDNQSIALFIKLVAERALPRISCRNLDVFTAA